MELKELDSSGRGTPYPIKGSEYTTEIDTVIFAIGQTPDLGLIANAKGIKTTRQGIVAVDPVTLETGASGIFAGGDMAWTAGTVIEAIAAGKRAAVSIDRFLQGD